MIRLREAKYCNLKLLLIWLVIYAHTIEGDVSSISAQWQYRVIYHFHMPLFVFVFGLFIRDSQDCIKQIKRLLPVYLVWQVAYMLFDMADSLFVPGWTLWYLLSCCIWSILAWAWFRIKKNDIEWIVLLLLVLLGAGAGYCDFIGRSFSLSRTIVFLPYFFAGLICTSRTKWNKYRKYAILPFVAAICLIIVFGRYIPQNFLYHAEPYGEIKSGFFLRMICYFIGGAIGFFLLCFIPDKRYTFTKFGADTLGAYLSQTLIIFVLKRANLHYIINAVLCSFFIFAVYKANLWRGKLCGITKKEGRSGYV